MAERGRPKAELVLTDDERDTLERWARRPKSAQALALRCRIVLECASAHTNREVARRLGVSEATVSKWRRRFISERLEGLHDEPRPGVPRSITDDHVEALIVATLEQTPTDATHWSTRSMAKATGMSQSAVSRIWRAFGLKPHLVDSFKLSLTLSSWRKSATSWVFTSILPKALWCCAWTRRPRSRPSIAPPRCSHYDQDSPNDAPTTMCEAALPTSMPPSTSPRARSLLT